MNAIISIKKDISRGDCKFDVTLAVRLKKGFNRFVIAHAIVDLTGNPRSYTFVAYG